MEQEFKVGYIVSVKGDALKQGEVTYVGVDYIEVRMPETGTVFSYYREELVATGRRIDPAKLGSVKVLTKALDDAERAARNLRNFRDVFVMESIVEVGE